MYSQSVELPSGDAIHLFVVGRIGTNCYAYASGDSCMVVDPGASGGQIAAELLAKGLKVKLVVATHGHHDHVCGVKALLEACPAPFLVGERDAWRVTQALEISSHAFGKMASATSEEQDAPEPDRTLAEGDVLEVGTARFRVMETPGHTEGGIVLVGEGSAEGIAFVGDTLFPGSCGRTDLLGGDHDTIIRSLSRMGREIAPDTMLLCGHGSSATMGRELATNPFVR